MQFYQLQRKPFIMQHEKIMLHGACLKTGGGSGNIQSHGKKNNNKFTKMEAKMQNLSWSKKNQQKSKKMVMIAKLLFFIEMCLKVLEAKVNIIGNSPVGNCDLKVVEHNYNSI